MGGRDAPIIDALPISHRNPTFPLPAVSSVDLLLCLVTSIHGMRGLKRLKLTASEDSTTRRNRMLWQAFDRLLCLRRTHGVGN